jgi:hypothetical protein
MSLDVYLELEGAAGERMPYIPVREDGRIVHYTKEAWDEKYPDRPFPHWITPERDDGEVYTGNITHNLARMARKVPIMGHTLHTYLWRPDEINVTKAEQLITPLRLGLLRLVRLEGSREHYEQYNPENGWGNYNGLVRFTEEYLAACEMWPDAKVSVWR